MVDRTEEDILQDDRLDSLESRVTAIESMLAHLNATFKANDLLNRVTQLEKKVG
jgi:hypothetical protein